MAHLVTKKKWHLARVIMIKLTALNAPQTILACTYCSYTVYFGLNKQPYNASSYMWYSFWLGVSLMCCHRQVPYICTYSIKNIFCSRLRMDLSRPEPSWNSTQRNRNFKDLSATLETSFDCVWNLFFERAYYVLVCDLWTYHLEKKHHAQHQSLLFISPINSWL